MRQEQLPDESVCLKIPVSYWRPLPPLDLSAKAVLSPAAVSSRLSCGAPALGYTPLVTLGYTPLAPAASPALSYKVRLPGRDAPSFFVVALCICQNISQLAD